MGLKRYINNLFRHDSVTRKSLNGLHLELQTLRQEVVTFATKEFVRTQYLQDKLLNSKEMGISNNILCENEVVVSLTTYGIRIHDVYLAIESIMQGSVKPNRIVLWLSKEEFAGEVLPITLQKQVKRGLEIAYCNDILSYKKLIPSLKKFPNACIITIDDDVMYDFDFVERLVQTHIKHPRTVCANRIHRMKLDDTNKPISYMQWEWCVNDYMKSKLNFLTGIGGVLYPPYVFSNEVFNESVFMEICRYADDIWFKSMLLLNNVGVIKSYTRSLDSHDYLEIDAVKHVGLCYKNTNPIDCRNDVQIKAVWEKYQIDKLM